MSALDPRDRRLLRTDPFGELRLGQWKLDTLIFQEPFDHTGIDDGNNDFVRMCN